MLAFHINRSNPKMEPFNLPMVVPGEERKIGAYEREVHCACSHKAKLWLSTAVHLNAATVNFEFCVAGNRVPGLVVLLLLFMQLF